MAEQKMICPKADDCSHMEEYCTRRYEHNHNPACKRHRFNRKECPACVEVSVLSSLE